jgi:hypothetical protein
LFDSILSKTSAIVDCASRKKFLSSINPAAGDAATDDDDYKWTLFARSFISSIHQFL